MSSTETDSNGVVRRLRGFGLFFRAFVVVELVFVFLVITNRALSSYFSWREVLLAVGFASLLVVLVLEKRKLALALALVIPQTLIFGAVNPVQRGLGVFTQANLFRFVHLHKELLQKKWIVYSDNLMPSGYFTGIGCDVYTGIKYVPDVEHFPVFRSRGISTAAFNRGGILIARALPANVQSTAETPSIVEVIWNVSPSDPILKQFGISYFAFMSEPPAAIASQLVPLSEEPIDGFWIYKLRTILESPVPLLSR